MAVTRKADVLEQIPSIWAKDLYAQAEKLTFWHRFEGPEGSSMPLIRRDDLEKSPGDTVKLDIVLALTGAGLTGGTANGLLDGNEEKLKFRQTSYTVDALRHGVRWEKLGKILITHDMRSTALMQLRKWLAGKLDDAVFGEFSGDGQATIPGKNVLVNAGGTFTKGSASIDADDVTAGDTVTLDSIVDIKAYAKTELQVEPIRMEDGEEVYLFVMHPYAKAALKKSSDWKQAQREARERGASNPLFRGALGVYDNVIMLEADRVKRAANAGAVQVATNLFLGAQGVARGYAYYPDWTEQYFSYGEEQGIGTFVVKGEKAIVFDFSAAGDGSANQAIGFVQVLTAAPTGVA
jgi:N4-gp56 family major capsid protein